MMMARTRRAFLRGLASLGGSAAGLGILAACAAARTPPGPAPNRTYRVGVLVSNREPMSATNTIPIVMVAVTDPVGDGFVQSLARPGGNVTGVADAPAETDLKRLQLLAEAVPSASRMAVLVGTARGVPVWAAPLSDSLWEAAAQAAGVDIVWVPFTTEDDIEAGVQRAVAAGAGALLVPDALSAQSGGLFSGFAIEGIAERYRLPAMYNSRTWIPRGGLMTYTSRRLDLWRRAAEYTDRILRGSHPAGLPVELPERYELVLNMRTARALGLRFSRDFLARVDEVVE
jgi:putative ABC transport system substrate-binding protein